MDKKAFNIHDFKIIESLSILTHNLYCVFALKTGRYTGYTAKSTVEKILFNTAEIKVKDEEVIVCLKKKRTLPLLLEIMEKYKDQKIPWLSNKKLINYLCKL